MGLWLSRRSLQELTSFAWPQPGRLSGRRNEAPPERLGTGPVLPKRISKRGPGVKRAARLGRAWGNRP